MSEPAKILIADDQEDIWIALKLLLKAENAQTIWARSPAKALHCVQQQSFDTALIDLNYARDKTSGSEGLSLLLALSEAAPSLPIIVMTAWGTIDTAVAALKAGARDFIEKPWDNRRLISVVMTQVTLGRTLRESRRLREENMRLKAKRHTPPMIGRSAAMARVLHMISKVAPSRATVLITGEHGTGKEVVARHLHAASQRANGPFIAVDAGRYSDGVFESELFGHVRGAFTDAKTDRKGAFEAAEGGTIFLDEIGNMPIRQQAKLLRVLQTGEVAPVGQNKVRAIDARVVAATNVDLEHEVRQGRFREDLLYRLNTVNIRLPSLREREDDILDLAAHFLADESVRTGAEYRFHPGAVARLKSHCWPGNVRELAHAVERGALLSEGTEILAADLGLSETRSEKSPVASTTLEDAERFLIEQAIVTAQGNVSQAAMQLGVSRSALYRRLQRYEIDIKVRRM